MGSLVSSSGGEVAEMMCCYQDGGGISLSHVHSYGGDIQLAPQKSTLEAKLGFHYWSQEE